jgi:quercetin dioxygenase-like cupin family protein
VRRALEPLFPRPRYRRREEPAAVEVVIARVLFDGYPKENTMRYVRVSVTNDGGSQFVDAELEDEVRTVAEGVPPLRVAGPYEATQIMFVVQSGDATDWHHHVAPRRQWVIVQTGRVAVTVTGGERREFGPGDALLVEDTTGTGHLSTPLTDNVTLVLVPTAPST